jgi:hypothetical protein
MPQQGACDGMRKEVWKVQKKEDRAGDYTDSLASVDSASTGKLGSGSSGEGIIGEGDCVGEAEGV